MSIVFSRCVAHMSHIFVQTHINMRFAIIKHLQGQWSWGILSRNGRVIARSLVYTDKRGCLRAIDAVRNGASDAIIDVAE
jgi:uncharacterized protein YegP (UPF0339 family)